MKAKIFAFAATAIAFIVFGAIDASAQTNNQNNSTNSSIADQYKALLKEGGANHPVIFGNGNGKSLPPVYATGKPPNVYKPLIQPQPPVRRWVPARWIPAQWIPARYENGRMIPGRTIPGRLIPGYYE